MLRPVPMQVPLEAVSNKSNIVSGRRLDTERLRFASRGRQIRMNMQAKLGTAPGRRFPRTLLGRQCGSRLPRTLCGRYSSFRYPLIPPCQVQQRPNTLGTKEQQRKGFAPSSFTQTSKVFSTNTVLQEQLRSVRGLNPGFGGIISLIFGDLGLLFLFQPCVGWVPLTRLHNLRRL